MGRKDEKDTSGAPDIPYGFDAWVRDFFELSNDRQITGYGAGPIPSGTISRHVANWQEDEADFFRACIRAMDREYLNSISASRQDIEDPSRPKRNVVGEMTPDKFDAMFG